LATNRAETSGAAALNLQPDNTCSSNAGMLLAIDLGSQREVWVVA
jgi:hypothetical protein